MRKRKFPLLLVMGICLVALSVLLLLGYQLRLRLGAQHSEQVVKQISRILPERKAGIPGIYPVSDMPALEVEGNDYVAVLEIPSFDLALPIAAQWNGNQLHRSPARFSGSIYDSTLIVGGVYDSSQFGFCDKIQHGAQITVTDMTGTRFTYSVSRIDRAKHAQTRWLTDAECDLTLFCHDIYSMEYLAVRCALAYN